MRYRQALWEANEYADARAALLECRKINPEYPGAVAERIGDMFELIKRALAPIEEEAERRDHAISIGKGDYYREMHDLAADFHELIIGVLKTGGGKAA